MFEKSWLSILPTLVSAFFAIPAAAELTGEADAIAMAEAIVERAGGHEAWRELRYLHARIKGYRSSMPFEVDEDLWTEFHEPYVYFSMTGEEFEYTRAVTPEFGWTIRNGAYSELTGDELEMFQRFWRGSEHVLYYRMASGDHTLKVAKVAPNRLEFFDAESNAPLGWFEVNDANEPVRWTAPIGDGAIEYVFGPLVPFGEIRLPKWGALIDGSWRFENVDIVVGTDAPPLAYEPPDGSLR